MRTSALLLVSLMAAAWAQLPAVIEPSRELDNEDPEARLRYFYEPRVYPGAYPGSEIPAAKRLAAHRQLNAARARTSGKRARFAESTWRLAGPKPTRTPGNALYSTAGRVSAMAIDPRDSKVIYAGPADGGLWKTTDGGDTWIPLTDDAPSLAMGSIALDPKNPDIVYVGTGELNFSGDSYYGAGILKSTDGGATWRNIPGPFVRGRVGALAIHPEETNIILAGTDRNGLFRSTDAGETWDLVLSGSTSTEVMFDPTGRVAFAALGSSRTNARNGIYKSTDKGLTWTASNGSGTQRLPSANVGRVQFTMQKSNPNLMMAVVGDGSTETFGRSLGTFKSTDGGANWQTLAAPDHCNPQCWYNLTVAIHPTDPDIIFMGGVSLYRSIDGGRTWAVAGTGPNGVAIHVDQHVLKFTDDGSRLWVGNDGGIWSAEDTKAARVNWKHHNDTLAVTQFYPGLSMHPADPSIGLGGTQDNGTQRMNGEGQWDNVTCGDGGWTTIDPSNPVIAYVTCQNLDIRRTLNVGNVAAGLPQGWPRVVHGIATGERLRFIPAFVMDPANPQRLYFGTQRIWQSNDGGGIWRSISPDLASASPTNLSTITSIAIAPGNTNMVYASSGNAQVWVSDNASEGENANWTRRMNGLPNRGITQVRVDPGDANIAYVTVSGFAADTEVLKGHVYKTVDAGENWTDISGDLPNLPVNDLVVDPDFPRTLYIGTDLGVMVTTNGGENWTDLGSGLPRSVVLGLTLHRATRTLRAGTHGRSVWDYSLGAAEGTALPVIESIEPARASAGASDFTLTIRGQRFGSGARVLWNGSEKTVLSSSGDRITVAIPASDLAQIGRAGVAVFNPGTGGGLSIPAEFTIGERPSVEAGSLRNWATPNTGGPDLAPYALATVRGENLTGVTARAEPGTLPSVLGGVSVIVSTSFAPILSVAPDRIVFQVPAFVVNPGQVFSNVPVFVVQGTQPTSSLASRVISYAPALFSINGEGNGQGNVRFADFDAFVGPPGSAGEGKEARPAKKGERINVYGTGWGPISTNLGGGNVAPANPLIRTTTEPVVTIGGVRAELVFSGLAPNEVGWYVASVRVPERAPSGPAVPVELTIGGVTSNTVTVAIE